MNIEKLKGAIQKTVAKTGVSHQSVYDMYFFEQFLFRLSISKHKEKFVFKGGFLLENMLGVSARTTMDIDLKAMKIEMSDKKLMSVMKDICKIDADDEIEYAVLGIEPITAETKYNGKSVKIQAKLKNLKKTFGIDIAQGDIVTPYPQRYTYNSSIDDLSFELFAYTKETIIAEKFETLVTKGLGNSRAKDLFDIYLLMNDGVDADILYAAIINTFYKRETAFDLQSIHDMLQKIHTSKYRKELYEKYAKTHSFVKAVSFEDVMSAVYKIFDILHGKKIILPNVDISISFIRHGEDEQDKVGGWSDNHLTALGKEQIAAVAETLDEEYDYILSSDLIRTKESAEIIGQNISRPIVYIEGLRETNNGTLKNLTKKEFIKGGYKHFTELGFEENYQGGESPKQFYERVQQTFCNILKEYNGKKILIVSHGGVITVIECLLKDYKYSNLLKIVPPHASKTEINIKNGKLLQIEPDTSMSV